MLSVEHCSPSCTFCSPHFSPTKFSCHVVLVTWGRGRGRRRRYIIFLSPLGT